MKNTAAKTQPPKAKAPAESPSPRQPAPAPPGSTPDAAAIERIRELRSKIVAGTASIQTLDRACATERQFFREQVTERLLSRNYNPETPVEALWELYEKQVTEMGEVGYAKRDMQECHARYEAAKQPLKEAVEQRAAHREQLHQLLLVEGAKLSVALREGGKAFRANAIAAVAPFCQDAREAEEAIGELRKVQDFIIAEYRWKHGTSADVAETAASFLNAWEQLNTALASISEPPLSTASAGVGP